MFNFTSLLGARSSSSASISLLQLEAGINILVDVGWDESFDASLLKSLESHVPSISLILLTHATTSHLGAFAHCCKHFPQFKSIPVYATVPVISLGRALLQDIYATNPIAASTIPQDAFYNPSQAKGPVPNMLHQPPTNEDITEYFNLIRPLKFSQPFEPEASPSSPPLNGLTITAYSAGHSLGGTIWHIQHDLESIVYAVDWNQAKETALLAAAWLSAGGTEVIESLRRPTALICSSRCSQRVMFPREQRDSHLINLIKTTISNGGSVLIPSDSCARSLELAYFLENTWNDEKSGPENTDSLKNASLYFASASAGLTMRHAKSMLEWMDPDIVREFESLGQDNRNQNQQDIKTPFDFKHLRFVEKARQIKKMMAQSGPKVILASDLSLEWGHARTFFDEFCANEQNLVVLSQPITQTPTGRESISHTLWNLWCDDSSLAKANGEIDPDAVVETAGQSISFTHAKMEKLGENETILYQQYLAAERQKQWTIDADKATNLRPGVDDAIDDNASSSSDESEESDDEQQGKVLNVTTNLSSARHKAGLTDAELGIDILIRRKGHYDYDVRGKRGRERMFPIMPPKKAQRSDEYGEIIRPDDYLRAEERENLANDQKAHKSSKEVEMGQKRKWGQLSQTNLTAAIDINGSSKKRKVSGKTQDDGVYTDSGYDTMGNGTEFGDDSDSDDEAPEKPEGPVKVVYETKTITINMRLAHADFSGLHDRRSMQMLIPLIRPRKLVLTGGDPEETMALQAECEKLLDTDTSSGDNASEVFTPAVGETLNASVDTNAWNVKLSDALGNIKWQMVGSLGVYPLSGQLKAMAITLAQPQHQAKRLKGDPASKAITTTSTEVTTDANDAEVETVPVLDVVASTAALSATRVVARPLHVGDVRLSDLRRRMQSMGVGAEFRGEGTLLVNGQVVVRKSAVGKIEVEAVIGLPGFSITDSTFDIVRTRIYESLALISQSS
ncbi:putative cleavage and polyadenylylation specificity factor [Microthyrium microscopicum]|uniref:Cleavage and polyadenylation specificity factor subunit 2 n=1 Tax=Microthyrium microscopicum TaxID=703497 RepID=A0A6A6TX92_9PEZI|nr:putative cleavage and polyadenylylation specificity factor [Microthyrium microscopicum]